MAPAWSMSPHPATTQEPRLFLLNHHHHHSKLVNPAHIPSRRIHPLTRPHQREVLHRQTHTPCRLTHLLLSIRPSSLLLKDPDPTLHRETLPRTQPHNLEKPPQRTSCRAVTCLKETFPLHQATMISSSSNIQIVLIVSHESM